MGLDRVFVSIRNSKSGHPRMVTATKTMRDILVRQKGRRIEADERVFAISKMTLRRRGKLPEPGLGSAT
jgi:hypothetical protein